MRCTEWVFGAAGTVETDWSFQSTALPAERGSRPRPLPAVSGAARGCRAPPGGVPRGWDAVGALLGVNGWTQPGGLTQVLFESEEGE